MISDYEKVGEYVKSIKQVESYLGKHQELFDSEKLIEFNQVTSTLEHNIELAKNDSRKLSIGIVGAVKAGKSSFLNACVFGGEDYLPKAATPMTAALTKISYSETPRAIIHFYTKEDWNTIEDNSAKYDENLKKDYDEYYNKVISQNAQIAQYGSVPAENPMTFEEFEKKYDCKSEIQRGAKELTRMVKDKDPILLGKLGNEDEIDGDIINKLNDYIGADGRYTAIVSYVELQVDNPNVQDLEIVDTPGLNDPIVSRGIITKQFLRSCDVVLLLSPCSQFMDSQTVKLMARNLPDAGVREILIVGSKLDSGILNENDRNFAQAYKKALNSYRTQFAKNIEQARNTGGNIDVLDKMTMDKTIFASSTCFSIDRKMKENLPLDENEQIVYNNLHKNFEDFEDKYLVSLGGINKVKEKLNEVLSRKNEIIKEKNTNLLENAKNNHLRILEKILRETVSSRTKLETTSAEELLQRSSIIRDTIDSSREKLMYIFDKAKIQCYGKVHQIEPQLTVETGQHQKIAISTSSHEEQTTKGVGLFGWKKELVNYTVTNNTADISSVINNIKMYSARCKEYVNNEFKYIFNKEELVQEIKNVVLDAFSRSQKEFDEQDILLPLRNVLDKISIPHIELDFTPYIDEVNTRFKSGFAQNEEIHQLNSLQSKLLDRIETELSTQLVRVLNEITKTLDTQAVNFADQIQNDLCKEHEKLQGQVKERERYIEEYLKFAQNVKEMKASLS